MTIPSEAVGPGVDPTLASLHASTDAHELHEFARRYNVNDGFEPLRAILDHPRCDAGTAALIYWQFHELIAEPALRAENGAEEDPRWNAAALLDQIEARYPDGFATNLMPFFAAQYLEPGPAYRQQLLAGCRNPRLAAGLALE